MANIGNHGNVVHKFKVQKRTPHAPQRLICLMSDKTVLYTGSQLGSAKMKKDPNGKFFRWDDAYLAGLRSNERMTEVKDNV